MHGLLKEGCPVCRSISGVERISPGPFICEGEYWLVDHAYPSAHPGWLVIVLKRHCEALHELSREEFLELGELQHRAIQALAGTFSPKKEYLLALGEGAGFSHLHVHIIQRPEDLPEEHKGVGIFKRLSPEAEGILPAVEIVGISEAIGRRMGG